MHALGGEELTRDRHVLGGHRQSGPGAYPRQVVESLVHRHADATARDPGGKGAITVNIQANSGGELRTNNNVVVLLTSVQR